jgi:hypothetical protein
MECAANQDWAWNLILRWSISRSRTPPLGNGEPQPGSAAIVHCSRGHFTRKPVTTSVNTGDFVGVTRNTSRNLP